jgi:uncharacterized protein
LRGFQPDGPAATLDASVAARDEEGRRGGSIRLSRLRDTLAEADAAGVSDVDLRQAITSYRTERSSHPHSTNRRLAADPVERLASSCATYL